jgi:hypothetical protein
MHYMQRMNEARRYKEKAKIREYGRPYQKSLYMYSSPKNLRYAHTRTLSITFQLYFLKHIFSTHQIFQVMCEQLLL